MSDIGWGTAHVDREAAYPSPPAILSDGSHGDPLLAAIADANTARLMMQRVLDAALTLIPAADGAVIELPVEGHLGYVCAAGTLAPQTGLIVPLKDSLSGLTFRTGEALLCADSTRDARVNADACAQAGVTSMVCVPLSRCAETIGVLKVSSRQPAAFDTADLARLEPTGEFIATVIDAAGDIVRAATQLAGGSAPGRDPIATSFPAAVSRPQRDTERFIADVLWPGMARDVADKQLIEQVLSDSSIQTAYQPIVALGSGQLIAVEALARFPDTLAPTPDRWFAQAAALGLGVELELLAVTNAARALPRLPGDIALTINASAATILDPRLPAALNAASPERIVLELTEHVPVNDYRRLRDRLNKLRDDGLRLAVDDTGAGFANLEHIVHLAPELIKLDRVFARTIDRDPARRAVAQAMLSLAGDIGAEVIAEGIETRAELETIRALGIPYGQGYLLSRPQPLGLVPRHFPILNDPAYAR